MKSDFQFLFAIIQGLFLSELEIGELMAVNSIGILRSELN